MSYTRGIEIFEQYGHMTAYPIQSSQLPVFVFPDIFGGGVDTFCEKLREQGHTVYKLKKEYTTLSPSVIADTIINILPPELKKDLPIVLAGFSKGGVDAAMVANVLENEREKVLNTDVGFDTRIFVLDTVSPRRFKQAAMENPNQFMDQLAGLMKFALNLIGAQQSDALSSSLRRYLRTYSRLTKTPCPESSDASVLLDAYFKIYNETTLTDIKMSDEALDLKMKAVTRTLREDLTQDTPYKELFNTITDDVYNKLVRLLEGKEFHLEISKMMAFISNETEALYESADWNCYAAHLKQVSSSNPYLLATPASLPYPVPHTHLLNEPYVNPLMTLFEQFLTDSIDCKLFFELQLAEKRRAKDAVKERKRKAAEMLRQSEAEEAELDADIRKIEEARQQYSRSGSSGSGSGDESQAAGTPPLPSSASDRSRGTLSGEGTPPTTPLPPAGAISGFGTTFHHPRSAADGAVVAMPTGRRSPSKTMIG